MSKPLVVGEFIFRPFTSEDATTFALAVRESYSSLAPWMPWAHPSYSETEALAWFQLCFDEREKGAAYEYGIFTANGELLGGCGLNQFNIAHHFCNLGYWVRQTKQRLGAATAAVTALSDVAFKQLNLARIEIVIAQKNTASLGVAKKSGATYECMARNRLMLHGKPVFAHVFSISNESFETSP
jgi:ribosomal-protein-serine acetyltransferase